MNVLKQIELLLMVLIILLLSLTCSQFQFDNPYDSNGIFKGRPVIVLEGSDTTYFVWKDKFKEPGYKVVDDKDKKIKVKKTVKDEEGKTIDIDDFTAHKGSYIIYYDATDKDDNKADTKTRIVVVDNKENLKDVIPPIIELKGGDTLTINVGDDFNVLDTFRAIDDPGSEDITDAIIRTVKDKNGNQKSIDDFYKAVGTYTVFYDVRDMAGNNAKTVEREVKVKPDNEKPVITLNGPKDTVLFLGQPYDDPGATAIDNVDGDITDKIEVSGDEVNTSIEDEYKIIYTVYDNAGNKAKTYRMVNVILDETPPVFKLNGEDTVTVFHGKKYKELKATAIDDVDGDISHLIEIGGDEVNTSIVDTYVVKYTISDAAGNESELKREVFVVDTTPPVITVVAPNPYNLGIGMKYTENGATALDNADGDLTSKIVKSGDSVDVMKEDTFRIHYTVSDNSGNETDSVRIVIVIKIPLEITTQPKNYTVKAGGTARFSIGAKGSMLTYQWQSKGSNGNWSDIPEATTNVLKFKSSTSHNKNQYKCIVSGYGGDKIESDAATLTVVE